MEALMADMRPYLEAGHTTAQALAAVRRTRRAARAGGGRDVAGQGGDDSGQDSSDGGGAFRMASDEYEY